MQDQSSSVSFCPSFSSYAHNISSVAARVREEEETRHVIADSDRSDSEFEFVLDGPGASSPSAIPLFDRGLLTPPASPSRLVSLEELFIEEERGQDSSDSGSETDEVDEIPPDAYCIWKPRASPSPSPSPDRCRKSNSTGSSASASAHPSSSKPKWRIRDLLRRSRSDGKESYVFLTRHNQNPKKDKADEAVKSPPPAASKGKAKGKVTVSAHEALYVRNKAQRDVDKRRSYLPYRQDLVGFFSVNGLAQKFPPFA